MKQHILRKPGNPEAPQRDKGAASQLSHAPEQRLLKAGTDCKLAPDQGFSTTTRPTWRLGVTASSGWFFKNS
ncbi:hypothetical protein TWF106_004495 [Orbilia oligospora]|uniref:Uncharacterized protein n=1 Tax=Orbilia oligospora TaxID=2813651 RepID=A0A7C8UHM8_ORBOL|nr:hypothetical protein TWF106_004495 [Orbilia oligospora]